MEPSKNFFCPRGHHNLLKRLISDKEIQGKQRIFLGKIWLKLGLPWPGFDKFGVGLDGSAAIIQGRADKENRAAHGKSEIMNVGVASTMTLWRAARATRIGARAIGRFDAVGSCGEKIYVTGSGTPAEIVKKAATLCSCKGSILARAAERPGISTRSPGAVAGERHGGQRG